MAGYQSFWCPSGGDWYTCRTGTFFAGCCAVDPCNDTCPEQHLYPVFFNPALYGEFPDMSCEAAGQFYTCTREAQEEAFFGCCKSDPCRNNATCPDGNLLPAFMERPDQIDLFGDPSVNNMGAPPVTTSSVVIATGPAMASTHIDSGNGSGYSRDVILPSISVAIMVALCAFVALWLGLRKIFSRGRHAYVSVEPMNSSNDPAGSPKPDTHAAITETSAIPVKDDFQRLGLKSALALLASVLAVLAMCAFLMFLWFGDSKNGTWKHIMVQGWATRSVAVTALILRTCVDLQAAVACAILAALLLESRTGIHLYQAASMSSMRTGNTSPWTFANCVLEEIWRSTAQSRRNHHVYAMAVFLLLTTSVLQFSSTLLLSDLQIGQLVGAVTPSEVLPGLSYSIKSPKKIARDSAWTTNPPNYATFGEYHEPPPETTDGIADTGMLLRAFLPYPAAGLRQTLASYRGNALTIDARVACQKPLITEFKGKGLNAQITGIVSPTKNVTMMQPIKPTPFDCTVAGVNQTTICQLGRPDDDFIGSLKSQFEKSTAYGTAFLIINGSSITSTGSEWQTLSFPKTNVTTMMNMPKKKNEASIALTLCFAPWDAAILDVTLDSKVNGTEPLIRYYKEFEPWEVLNYLIPVAQNGTRQVMEMQKPHSFLGDLPPPYRRPVVQSDIGGSSASSVGTIFPLPGNWSVFLTGTPLVTHLRSLESPSSNITSADPVLASIFNVAMRDGYGVAWALSSLITVLSMTNYYGQQVAFDRVDTVVVSFFENVLYPRSSTGLTILFWTLVAHIALLALLVVLFVTKTQFTLVGNAWSAFAQVAESREVKEYMAGASLTDDSTLLDQLRKSGKGDLRARLVGRGDGAEVKVE